MLPVWDNPKHPPTLSEGLVPSMSKTIYGHIPEKMEKCKKCDNVIGFMKEFDRKLPHRMCCNSVGHNMTQPVPA